MFLANRVFLFVETLSFELLNFYTWLEYFYNFFLSSFMFSATSLHFHAFIFINFCRFFSKYNQNLEFFPWVLTYFFMGWILSSLRFLLSGPKKPIQIRLTSTSYCSINNIKSQTFHYDTSHSNPWSQRQAHQGGHYFRNDLWSWHWPLNFPLKIPSPNTESS